MREKFSNRLAYFLHQRTILSIIVCYTLAWSFTTLSARIVWGDKLGSINPLFHVFDFLFPLALMLAFLLIGKKITRPARYLGVFFLLFFIGIVVNLLVFKIPFVNYGDDGTLSTMVGKYQIFPRWLLGTGVLNFLKHGILEPIFGWFSNILFIKISGALLMCVLPAILLYFKPDRMSLMLTFFSPIWLLFSLGYNEYYPFLSPLFIIFLLFLSTKVDDKVSPLLIGLLAAIIGVSYAGFLPLSLLLLFTFAIWRGLRNGVYASLVFLISFIALIVLFWGINLPSYWREFGSTLNLSDPDLFSGQAMNATPFFKPQFAFGIENLKRAFLNFFWSGSFPFFFLILGGFGWLLRKKDAALRTKPVLFLGLFLLYQVFYFFFMIPRLGPVQDIDLYFTVYITFAFTAGWLFDHLTANLDEVKQKNARLVCFAFCAGCNAIVMLYFLFLGVYALA